MFTGERFCRGCTMCRRLSVSILGLLLATLQTILCSAFVVPPTISIQKRPTAFEEQSKAVFDISSLQSGCGTRPSLLPPEPRAPRWMFHPTLQYRQVSFTRMGTKVDASPLHGGNASANSAIDQSLSLEDETRRLMSVPTIDIKLELQMRGVEHRDAFEKLDLAKRLADVRLRAPSAGYGGGGDVGSIFPSDSRGPSRAAQQVKYGVAAEVRTADDVRSSSPRWRRLWSRPSEPIPPVTQGEPHEEGAEKGERADEYHPHYVARAVRMGKPGVIRELNAMGIAHSRLSDMAVLARQYASAKSEARSEVEKEAGLFVIDKGLDQQLEATRLAALGKTELAARLRALGVDFSRQASEAKLGVLLAKAGGEGAAAAATAVNPAKSASSSSSRDDGEDSYERTSGRGKRSWGWERWNMDRQHEGTASVFPRSHGQDVRDEDEEEGEEEEEEEEEEKIEGPSDQGPRRSGDSDVVPDGETSWGDFGRRELPAGVTLAAEGGGGMKVPLQARAGRMSSRELMNALDSLGVAYPIPSPRSELEDAFVSAVLAGQGDETAPSEGGRAEKGIARLNPYSFTTQGEDASDGEYRPASFETYHAALRWARQLTLDDVVDELHYRRVVFKPNGEFSYLTRLLADEVLTDEELMEEEENREGYAEVLEAAVNLNAEEISADLRAGGIEFDADLSKTELARLLVEAKSQTRTPIAGRRQAASGRPRYPDSRKRDRAAATANRKVGGQKTRAQPYGGVGSRGLFGFEDDGEEPLSDSDQALLEIESIARSVGGAAWGAVQETASVFAGIASTLLPEVFPLPQEGEEDSAEEGAEGAPSRQRRRPARISQKRRTRMSRDRASGLRRGASTFVQSSANRAGLALVRSAANGVLRGAEAAADWAGGGAVAREHVLLFIAAFCLAFKRGIGSSVALLVLIRAGRISLQRLLEGGQAAATKRTGEDTAAGARSPRVAAVAAAAGGSTSGSGRREPTSSRGGRRNVPSGKPRRRPTIRQPSKTEERERRSRRTARAARAGRTRAKRGMQGRRRRPVADGLDDSDSDGGCAIM